ncbi:MAG: hypothetical protein ACI92G_002220 [Candidatus Pelagisphaera sp.]|jgi:hypothetical protein
MRTNAPALYNPKGLIFCYAFLVSSVIVEAEKPGAPDTNKEQSYWVFQPIESPRIPETRDLSWTRNPIDAFVLARLEKNGLQPSQETSRRDLIRRATLDLHGLPPAIAEVDAFLTDSNPDAYEHLIDRLLDSPRYGERYARHWLDLVRYADSDGFKADVLRPNAWRYRDYVIESLNENKSYARFVKEQIAGDELYPEDDDAKKATGYLRLWPYEDNQPDMSRHWEATLDDIADVSGDVFLGLSMKCARCHDHKFDPISQKDYYRFRAFFSAISPWEDIQLNSVVTNETYIEKNLAWEKMTAGIHAKMAPIRDKAVKTEWAFFRKKLPTYMQEILDTDERTPYEEQLARFAIKMLSNRSAKTFAKHIKGEELEQWQELKKELKTFDRFKPKDLGQVSAVRDIGANAPRAYVNSDRNGELVKPGYLSILDIADPTFEKRQNSTGQRAELARWLTDGENPLSSRVIVNRLWQWHFGTGIVASSNDFGHLGQEPTHPELLDWLARKFVEQDWDMKAMHRIIMTSSTYRQATVPEDFAEAEIKDQDNQLLWRMPVLRMDAEQLRDSMLFVSGEIDGKMGGPAVSEEETNRRSIYVQNKRNKLMTMMNAFDTPDLHNSCPTRDTTTTPIQALTLLNGQWSITRAERFADRVLEDEGVSASNRIAKAYRFAFGRSPSLQELESAQTFLEHTHSKNDSRRTAWIDLCHVLLNTNEFMYIN